MVPEAQSPVLPQSAWSRTRVPSTSEGAKQLRRFAETVRRRMALRASDRRDSPRVPLRFWVRNAELGGSFEERSGNVSMGGAFFMGPYESPGTEIEIAFWTPDTQTEIRARGEVIRSSQIGASVGVHVQLRDIDVRRELELARFIQRFSARQ